MIISNQLHRRSRSFNDTSVSSATVTRYPLSVIRNRYPLPVIRYPLPVTRYPLPVIRYPLSVIRYLVLSPPFNTAIMGFMKLKFVPNVPNILTLIRFLAIPALALLIYAGDDCNLAAFFLFAGIWLTDMLDGFIARRFNQITEFGKLFDPLVDKLFQLTTAVMMSVVGKLPIWVPLIIFFKELLMVAGSALLLKKKSTVVFAQWYGKVGTVLFVMAFAALFFLTNEQRWLADYIFIIPIAWSLYVCVRYTMAYLQPFIDNRFNTGQP